MGPLKRLSCAERERERERARKKEKEGQTETEALRLNRVPLKDEIPTVPLSVR